MKLNCWEFKKCGRDPGGRNVKQWGVCPASTEKRLHGVHDGTLGGRACWVVAGSLCGGKVQGTFVHKYKECMQCDFYQQVLKEEGTHFILTLRLLQMLGKRQELTKNNKTIPIPKTDRTS